MGWNDHFNCALSFKVQCPKCKKVFKVQKTRQEPGFRDMETLYCPYCNQEIEHSMEWEYHVEK